MSDERSDAMVFADGRTEQGEAPGDPGAVLDPVRIREVGPRDGFQNEPEVLSTADKVDLIDRLARTGVGRIELTSFVRPDVIPQLADASEVLAAVDVPAGVDRSVLIPNERGLDRALEQRERFDEVSVFLSASETHNRKNVNRSIAESLDGLERVIDRARAEGLRCVAVIATSFGCPYEGVVPPERTLAIAARLRDAGAAEIGFGDTTGMANPRQAKTFFARAFRELRPAHPAPGNDVGDADADAGDGDADAGDGDQLELTAHFHNTRGQGLANVVGALDAGCRSFESSFGELGGCPAGGWGSARATGNIATEDLVSMLHEMGYATGIDLDAVLDASRAVQTVLGRTLGSHSLVAGPIDWSGRA